MAKNFADLYNYTGDSTAVEQKFFLKEEPARGQLTAPTGADFIKTLSGGTIEFTQPLESSPIRSGRHHSTSIVKKKELSWNFSTYFMIDETLGAPGLAVIDPAARLLHKSLFGKEDVTSGAPVYNTLSFPNSTFSVFENGDKWGRQARGCFVDSSTWNLPGNGEATQEWSGMGVESYMIGIGKSTVDNNLGNTVTLAAGEGGLFRAGGLVMIVEADGVTRSADTPDGSPRSIVSVSGDVITLSGAALADADGAASEIYLAYYEPATPIAINNPVVGLVGSFAMAGLNYSCLRSGSLVFEQNLEPVDYCYGSDALDGSIFVPGNRFSAMATLELNLNNETQKMFNRLHGPTFEAQDVTIKLGDDTGRHLEILMPQIKFPIPNIPVPESGSIPISFEGQCQQTAEDAADEVTVSYL